MTHIRVPVHAPQGTPCTYVTSRCHRTDAGPHPDQPLVALLRKVAAALWRHSDTPETVALLSEIDEALRGEAVLEQGGKSR